MTDETSERVKTNSENYLPPLILSIYFIIGIRHVEKG